MSYTIRQLPLNEAPQQLFEISDPPKKLYIAGELPKERIALTVVGPRKCSAYGKEVCEKLITELAPYPVTIVSGLALGIDALAHKTALSVGLPTVSVPGSGLSPKVIYPRTHYRLSEEIVEKGGALLSEFEPEEEPRPYFFPKRNRIMAGLSEGVLIIEAEEKSGTLITARLALDYNRLVFVVPGPITSAQSSGANTLIKEGATPVTSGDEIASLLGIPLQNKEKAQNHSLSPEENELYSALHVPLSKDDIVQTLSWPIGKVNATLSLLEMKGVIKEVDGKVEQR